MSERLAPKSQFFARVSRALTRMAECWRNLYQKWERSNEMSKIRNYRCYGEDKKVNKREYIPQTP